MRRIDRIVCTIGILVITALACGESAATTSTPAPTTTPPYPETSVMTNSWGETIVWRFHDTDTGATCYVFTGGEDGGLSCLPDESLRPDWDGK